MSLVLSLNLIFSNYLVILGTFTYRTLTANSKDGTDHGWSGNSFMLGGSINGGKILGQYPDNLTSNSLLNVGKLVVISVSRYLS